MSHKLTNLEATKNSTNFDQISKNLSRAFCKHLTNVSQTNYVHLTEHHTNFFQMSHKVIMNIFQDSNEYHANVLQISHKLMMHILHITKFV